jgi:uncharacterized protein (DUF2267 family)
MLVRGFYYEGWKPADTPRKERHKEDFLAHVKHDFRSDEHMDAEQIVRAVFRVLARHISEGEIKDIQLILPAELRALWGPEDVKTWV